MSCMSNVKQLGMGVTMYLQDYDESSPSDTRVSSNTGVRWYPLAGQPTYLLEPYVKSTAAFRCPSVTANWTTWYGYNNAIGRTPAEEGPVTLSMVEQVADLVVLGDDQFGAGWYYLPSQGTGNWGANFCKTPATNAAGIQWGERPVWPALRRGVNVAFADGHTSGSSRRYCGTAATNSPTTSSGSRLDSGISPNYRCRQGEPLVFALPARLGPSAVSMHAGPTCVAPPA